MSITQRAEGGKKSVVSKQRRSFARRVARKVKQIYSGITRTKDDSTVSFAHQSGDRKTFFKKRGR